MRRSRLLLSTLLSVSIAGGLGTAPAAAEQGAWTPAVDVSEPARFTYAPDLGVSPQGVTLAVWPRGDERLHLWAAWRRPGQPWSTPRRVPGTRGAREVEAAYDRDGDLVLAFTSGRRVRVIRRPAGGSWGLPVTVHRTVAGVRGTLPASLDLAVNGVGRAVVAWETLDDDADATYARSRVQAAVGGPGGKWSRATTLSSARRSAYAARAAVSRTGQAVVVWDELAGNRRARVTTASRDRGEGWTESRALSRWLPNAGDSTLAALPSGKLAVAWSIGGSTPGIALRRRSPEGDWRRTKRIPGVKTEPWWLAIGMDGQGAVTLAWSNRAKSVWVAQQDQRWQRTLVAPSGSVFYGLQLEVNLAGDAVVGWDGRSGDDHLAQAAYRAHGGPWGPSTSLSDPRGDAGGAAVAIAGDGTATAAWVIGRPGSLAGRIQASTYGMG
ncbi:MAG TPA: hypothetical protein VLB29_12485 [Nocardioidaceae bacterium]|nr:hypothetical protein [Nocardioidaceae bacterium]